MSVRTAHLALALVLVVAIGNSATADEAADQYALAAGHYAAARWRMAADEFARLLTNYPQHARVVEATFFRGEALVQLAHPAEAEECFRELLRRWPDCRFAGQALFRQGEAAYLAGHDQTAKASLEQWLTQFPDDPRGAYALAYLAETDLVGGDSQAARDLFAKALQRYPQGPLATECQLGLGKAAEALGDAGEARKAYGQFIAAGGAGPLVDEARYRLGTLENAAGNYQAAVDVLSALVEREGVEPATADKAATAKAWALYKLARYADAERVLAPLVAKDAGNGEAQYCLGLVQAGDSRWSEAINPLEFVLHHAAEPARIAQARAALAICYARADRLKDAKATYQAFAENQPPAELAEATTYWLAEAVLPADPAWAGRLFESLTGEGAKSEYSARALNGLAWGAVEQSDPVGSAASFDRFLKMFPHDPRAPEAALVRGEALFEMLDQADPALSMYELVIEKFPASKQLPEALWKAGRLEQRLQRPRQAEARYRRLAGLEPRFGQYDALLWHWARVLDELERPEEAADTLERLRRDWPASPLALEAAYRLAARALAAKDYDTAARLAGEITAADPPPKILPEALYLTGQIALEREQWAEATAPLARLVRECPESPLVLAAKFWQAEASYRQRDYAKALEEFARLEDQTAGRAEKWLAMIPLRQAQALGQQNRWAEALEMAQRIATAYPDFSEQYEADYVIGRALASRGEFAAAREAYGRVIHGAAGAKTETAAMAQWMIGESYFHQESYAEAVAAYLRVEILYDWPKWQAGALLQAAKCQELLGQMKEAVETYERLIRAYPDSEFTEEAKRRLRVAEKHQPTTKS